MLMFLHANSVLHAMFWLRTVQGVWCSCFKPVRRTAMLKVVDNAMQRSAGLVAVDLDAVLAAIKLEHCGQ